MNFEHKKYYNRFMADYLNGCLILGIRSEHDLKEDYEAVPLPLEKVKEFSKFLNKVIKKMEKHKIDREKRLNKLESKNAKI